MPAGPGPPLSGPSESGVETIGKYQVQRVLGRGGMGTVYEALDPFIARKVALKTMIAGLVDNPELKARFLREAQAAGGLRHRNIVTVYDLGEDKGQPYIAMEFIEGTDLEKVIQGKEPRTVEWKLDVLRQVCEGLSYAHKNGIVHRDVKPANVAVTHDGEVKIMDFGIAHLQSSTMTKSGLVLGTVHYMAPEQIEGQKVDHRADIFSVGAIAYELIAYKRPFDGDTITAVMYKIMHDRPDPKALPQTEYSPGLQNIIMKCLARDVRERYQSLEDMRHDLAGLVRQMPTRIGMAADVKSAAAAAAVAAEQERGKLRQEIARMRAEVERARAEGQLQRALVTCRRLMELAPDDKEAAAMAKQIEAGILERQVEQLCETALAYAADGDMDLAGKIVGKVEKLAPASPRPRQLKAYLAEESSRRAAKALTATAQDHLAFGNLEEARAAAEEALAAHPSDAVAREIRDRAADILARRSKTGPPPAPVATAPASATPERQGVRPASAAATATPPPAPAAAAMPAAPASTPSVPAASVPPPAPPAPAASASGTSPSTASPDRRRSEVEALTSAALDHFLQNNHDKARKAIDKALAIDPSNKKAREMLRILGALG
jgi:tetratricopeptide (TPR) repeat protein/predicted Ser/Thr protein kinase